MLARDRNPEQTVITNLRIKESLRLVLEREAERHQISLNKEIINRLENSLQSAAKQDLGTITQDMMIAWMRYSSRFLALELEAGILEAVENGDLGAARSQVFALRKAQEDEARRQVAKAAVKDD